MADTSEQESREQIELELAAANAEAEAATARAEAAALRLKAVELQKQAAVAVSEVPVATTAVAATATAAATVQPVKAPSTPAQADVEPAEAILEYPEPDDESDAVYVPSRWSETIRGMSSFLVSAVVHTMALVILALISLSLSEQSPAMLLSASIDGEEDVDFEDLDAEVQFEPEDLERLATLNSAMFDPGMANLGEMASEAPTADNGAILPGQAADLNEIAAMFGDNGKGLAELGNGQGSASFFGVKAGGTKFVFVVDASKSMNRGKWEACQYQLLYSVQRLKPYQRFFVILFGANSYKMFGGEEPERFCVPATTENIQQLVRWLESFELELGTKPHESMKTALNMHPSAIYLLTDGQFTDPTEKFLRENNRIKEDFTEKMIPKATVHTIGIYSNNGQTLLKRIAEANGGTYQFIPPPPNFKSGGGKRPGQGGAKKK